MPGKRKGSPKESSPKNGSTSTRSGSCEAHRAGQPRLSGFRPGLRIRDVQFYSVVLFEPRLAFSKHVVLR